MRKKYEDELKELLELKEKSEIRSTDPEVIKESKNAKREYEKRLFDKYGLMGPNVLKQIQNVLDLKERILKEADEIDDRTIELTIEQEKIEKEIKDFDANKKAIEDLEKEFHELIEKEVEIQAKLKTAASEDEKKSLMEELDKVEKDKQDNNTKAIDLNNNNTAEDKKTSLIEKKNELKTQIDRNNDESSELKNKAARCDLVATCLIKGIEWKDIQVSLNSFKDRKFTCKDRKLYNGVKTSNEKAQKDGKKLETKYDLKEYSRRVQERIQGFEKVTGRKATEAEEKKMREEVYKDMIKERDSKDKDKDKDINTISKNLEKTTAAIEKAAKEEAAAKKAAEEAKKDNGSKNPIEKGKTGEFNTLKDDLAKDIKKIGEEAAAKEAAEEAAKKAAEEEAAKKAGEEEKKIGLFDAIKGWFSGLFNKNKTKQLNPADGASKDGDAGKPDPAEEAAAKEAAEKAAKEAAEKAAKEATERKAAEKAAREEAKKQNTFKNMYKSKDFDGIIENVAKKGMDEAAKDFSDDKMKQAKEAARNRDIQNEAKRLRSIDAKNGQLKYKVNDTGFADIDKQYYEDKAKQKYGEER